MIKIEPNNLRNICVINKPFMMQVHDRKTVANENEGQVVVNRQMPIEIITKNVIK